MISTSRKLHHAFRNEWTLDAAGSLALTMPSCERDAIFHTSPFVLLAFSIEVGISKTKISLETEWI